MKNPWKKISSKIVHKNNWYHIRKDKVIRPDGHKGEYNVMVNHPSVFIIPVNEKNEVYLIGLFRYPTNQYSIEVPAGGSEGKGLLQSAKKELKEETGLIAKTWKKVGKIQSANAFMSEIGHIYLATGLVDTKAHDHLEEGIQEVIKVPFKKAMKMIQTGEINDAQSIAALYLAEPMLKR